MTAELRARDRAAFWHPCGQMRDYDDFPPLEIVGASGSRLRLADGREILDAISSWWCKALGHGHPHLLAALRDQAAAFEHVITANTTNAPLVRLCERLLAAANGAGPEDWGPESRPGKKPGHFGKVFLADNGSTAVEIALKMALQAQAQRGHSSRTRFAAFANGYHGETVATLSVGDCDLYSSPYGPLMFPVTKLAGLPYRTGPEDPRWLDAGAEWPAIERALDAEADTLAAVIYEPVLQAAGEMRLYSPDLLRRLRRWADARGVYLIADEIAAGMGRLGAILASHLAEGPGRLSRVALPDFATLSKGLTGGVLPLSAVLTTDAIASLFESEWAEGRAFLHSNTYTGNALGVAVANAALDVFAREDILGRVAAEGPALCGALAELVARRPDLPFAGVRGAGMVAAVDLRGPGGQPFQAGHRTGYRVYREAVARGVLLRNIGDTMYLFPPLNVARADVAAMVRVLEASVEAVVR
jgi:adenosylmethionine-8-amino-7-oxononanoate aminotransferase